jgi:hypothetical protein
MISTSYNSVPVLHKPAVSNRVREDFKCACKNSYYENVNIFVIIIILAIIFYLIYRSM